jgi:hypothetical protein
MKKGPDGVIHIFICTVSLRDNSIWSDVSDCNSVTRLVPNQFSGLAVATLAQSTGSPACLLYCTNAHGCWNTLLSCWYYSQTFF